MLRDIFENKKLGFIFAKIEESIFKAINSYSTSNFLAVKKYILDKIDYFLNHQKQHQIKKRQTFKNSIGN